MDTCRGALRYGIGRCPRVTAEPLALGDLRAGVCPSRLAALGRDCQSADPPDS